jgi:hypothetical protein
MPISYQRDDAQRRILAVGEGPFLADDVIGIFARMRTEGTWRYATLYDVRRMFGKPSISDLRRILAAGNQSGEGPALGPMAVSSPTPRCTGWPALMRHSARREPLRCLTIAPRRTSGWQRKSADRSRSAQGLLRTPAT